MKKLLVLILVIFISAMTTVAQDSYVLKTSISRIDNIPKYFFGTWSVQATRTYTDSEKSFATSTLDLWNLRRSGNVIELRNPVTGAVADIYLEDVNGNVVSFTHYETEGNIKLKDTVMLTLNEKSFTGFNELTLDITKKDAYGKIVTEHKKARYQLKGSKFSQ